MGKAFTQNILLALFGLSFTLQLHAEELRCFAGLQPDRQKNEFTSEKKPQDFTTSETSLVRFGQTLSVRKYRVEIENFIVEGVLVLNYGIAAELSITDRTTGVVARVNEHGSVRLKMSSPQAVGFKHITATCTQY